MKHLINILSIILIAVYPVVFVFFRNEDFIREGGFLMPIALICSVSILLYWVLNTIKVPPLKSIIIVSLAMLWFLLYGHIYYFILETFSLQNEAFRHRYYFPVYTLLFIIAIVKIWLSQRVIPENMSAAFLIVGICLNIQFIVPFLGVKYKVTPPKSAIRSVPTAKYPDVYYIISDAYPSVRNLKTYYDFDNTQFVEKLNNLGFQVQENARSNYPYTYFSLASSLNMEYINYFEDTVTTEKANYDYPFQTIYTNKTVNYFKKKGYKYVLFQSAYEQLNDAVNADVYLTSSSSLNQFYQALLELTVLSSLDIQFYNKKILDVCSDAFDNVEQLKFVEGSKFVFMHILPPHPPYVFDAQGNYVHIDKNVDNRFAQKSAYIEQVKYVNMKLLQTVRSILIQSSQPPIIIIQGDHGTSSTEKYEDEMKWSAIPPKELLNERYGILNAIYMPDSYTLVQEEYDTPVNTFRKVCNLVFQDSLQVLPNKSYFARYRKPYNFQEIDWKAVQDSSVFYLKNL